MLYTAALIISFQCDRAFAIMVYQVRVHLR
jgi:hypothetical protein